MLDHTTTIERGGTPHVLDLLATDSPPIGETAEKFTETQAREWLDAERAAGRKTPVRSCAAAWAWSPATTGRFLSRMKSETAQPASVTSETARGPTATLIAETMRKMKAAGASPEVTGIVVEAVVDAAAAAKQGVEAKPEAPFDWSSKNEDVIVPEQRSIATYVNTWGQIVIKEAAYDDDDAFICLTPHAALALIERLKVLLPEAHECLAERAVGKCV